MREKVTEYIVLWLFIVFVMYSYGLYAHNIYLIVTAVVGFAAGCLIFEIINKNSDERN